MKRRTNKNNDLRWVLLTMDSARAFSPKSPTGYPPNCSSVSVGSACVTRGVCLVDSDRRQEKRCQTRSNMRTRILLREGSTAGAAPRTSTRASMGVITGDHGRSREYSGRISMRGTPPSCTRTYHSLSVGRRPPARSAAEAARGHAPGGPRRTGARRPARPSARR